MGLSILNKEINSKHTRHLLVSICQVVFQQPFLLLDLCLGGCFRTTSSSIPQKTKTYLSISHKDDPVLTAVPAGCWLKMNMAF